MVSNLGVQVQPLPGKGVSMMETSPNSQVPNIESVRSKMRESLTSALTLFPEIHNMKSNSSGSSSIEEKNYSGSCVQAKMSDSASALDATSSHMQAPASDMSVFAQTQPSDASYLNNDMTENTISCAEKWKERNCSFGKDELDGHRLCWASESNYKSSMSPEGRESKRSKLSNESPLLSEEQTGPTLSPDGLAISIETELFKIFGGVNKKYKEKGRSLLFNLKDPNNPDLRERVVSGQISPERLCNMSAEELASKELSQWRIAKAEELAQMVVLPTTDVSARRIVRKTHKGEFQVDLEQDDSSTVVEVTGSEVRFGGSDHIPQMTSKIYDERRETVTKSSGTFVQERADVIIENMNSATELPPIVSLDEFMSTFNSPTPVNSSEEITILDDKKMVDNMSSKEVAPSFTESESGLTSANTSKELVSPSKTDLLDQVWEGVLQLTLSAMVATVGFYRSGERTDSKEWPGLLEIKGRVRLDAFGKFLQELPHSKSRAVMVVQFCCKAESPESEIEMVTEVANSYVSDQRVGFAEPVPGVEIYFCPRETKMTEMLITLLTKDQSEIIGKLDEGLVGIVVWRRPQPIVSPKLSARTKKFPRKAHNGASKKEPALQGNGRFEPVGSVPPADSVLQSNSGLDEDDDVPPGFGPQLIKDGDEDDLPEFEFNKEPSVLAPENKLINNSRVPAAPVERMRALVQKYGNGDICGVTLTPLVKEIKTQPWDDDDDDDIPEWQPHEDIRPGSHLARPMVPFQPPLPSGRPPSMFSHPLPAVQSHAQLIAGHFLPVHVERPVGPPCMVPSPGYASDCAVGSVFPLCPRDARLIMQSFPPSAPNGRPRFM